MSAARYVKIDSAGKPLRATAKDWDAVLDNTTGLIWSRNALPCGRVNWKKAKTEVAKFKLCGKSDWRLPTHEELRGLIEDGLYNPAIDPKFFTFFTLAERWDWCWTGTECAPAGYAWGVYLYGGSSSRGGQADGFRVRAVRAGQALAIGKAAP